MHCKGELPPDISPSEYRFACSRRHSNALERCSLLQELHRTGLSNPFIFQGSGTSATPKLRLIVHGKATSWYVHRPLHGCGRASPSLLEVAFALRCIIPTYLWPFREISSSTPSGVVVMVPDAPFLCHGRMSTECAVDRTVFHERKFLV